MTSIAKAYVGARIHDGKTLHDHHALGVGQDGTLRVLPRDAVPEGCVVVALEQGIIAPGFVDLQVNGGGGVMFNDDQSVAALRTIAQAHATTGTVAILPTLITDTAARTRAAIDAVEQAIAAGVEGIVGLHLEGPHLSIARKGAHDPQLIRPMEAADLAMLLQAADRLPNLMITVAPESTSPAQIKAMAEAGIVVSLGHTDADYETCMAAFDAGARCVTHLFNAMSQLGNREPGLVGATLAKGDIYAGMIADGIHVHPQTLRLALAAKCNQERLFLVTDAMAAAGSSITGFTLNGREIYRQDHRLTLADGTLAGADLDMPRALSVMVGEVGDDLAMAIARTSAIPAQLLRHRGGLGALSAATQAIYMADDLSQAVPLAQASTV